ncbi:MAG: helix-turn-helix domain-containing protein [Ruminococcaceae bacterium]|nr:helix-turn-helix domain-containing protein [Oscillospiraceae bacterium]
MGSFGYNSFTDDKNKGPYSYCSVESFDLPLMINCAGCVDASLPFTTNNAQGRLDTYLLYVTHGNLCIPDGEKVINAPAGSVVLFPANQPYSYYYSGGERLVYLWAHFTGSEAALRAEQYGLDYFPCIHRAAKNNHIPQRFQSIFDAYTKNDRFRDRELSALLERLLITVARATARGGAEYNMLSSSIKYITEYYNTEIKIPKLAAIEHLSVSRYNFLFKKQMGITPTRHILDLRMSCATDLLRSTDLPIKQIANMCGYSDAQFFAKTFKAYHGLSPTEYRLVT